jgi:hypothetical protein
MPNEARVPRKPSMPGSGTAGAASWFKERSFAARGAVRQIIVIGSDADRDLQRLFKRRYDRAAKSLSGTRLDRDIAVSAAAEWRNRQTHGT